MAKEKICGIYKIECTGDQKVYIGQSVDIEKRWIGHKSLLKRNIHNNDYLQKAYNKYGEENFVYTILLECDKEELDEYERYYISVYNATNRQFGFNHESGGSLRKTVSEDTKKKLSEYNKKRFENPSERIKNSIAQKKRFEDPNERIKNSISQKKRYENPDQIKQNSQLRLRFYQTEAGKQRIRDYKEEMSQYWNDETWRNKQRDSKGDKIVQLTLTMELIKIWESKRDIEKNLEGVYRYRIKKCLDNSLSPNGNGYKNYIWLTKDFYESMTQEQIDSYIELYKDFDYENSKTYNAQHGHIKNGVVQLSLDMNVVKIWDSAEEIDRTTEFKSSSIRRCCSHQIQSYKGYIWMYEKEYSEYIELNKSEEE